VFGHPNDHLARGLIEAGVRHDAHRTSPPRRQRALVMASLLIVGDRRRPNEYGPR
jgi:hypothetical protein